MQAVMLEIFLRWDDKGILSFKQLLK